MKPLILVSVMAENFTEVYRGLADYLTLRGIPTQFVEDDPWEESLRRLARGEVQLGALCGLQYVQLRDGGAPLEVLAAPVMVGRRYAGRPVYFSHVLVARDSPPRRLQDLAGAVWAYNEPTSHSGYQVVCHHLACCQQTLGFFGKVVQSGAHSTSLQMILDGQAHAAAIDSTVLEHQLRRRPGLRRRIRILETLGPSPIPPVAAGRLDPQVKSRLQRLLLGMHEDPEGRAVLSRGAMARFGPVQDRDYEPIRRMYRRSAHLCGI